MTPYILQGGLVRLRTLRADDAAACVTVCCDLTDFTLLLLLLCPIIGSLWLLWLCARK